ncbi:MAG: hypothetical protein CM1200mP14_13530 [Gammaproteobacteria bacterium]|nr:MAG: hypothetical protein CM1200mP14_13530 [Gammaproteobacteria bacterium]
MGPELSMGMTNDFEIAIREGSTMVRVGTALFGDELNMSYPQLPDTLIQIEKEILSAGKRKIFSGIF